jgi:hypothetical protein
MLATCPTNLVLPLRRPSLSLSSQMSAYSPSCKFPRWSRRKKHQEHISKIPTRVTLHIQIHKLRSSQMSQNQSQFITDSQSVRLGFESLAGTHNHILAFWESCGVVLSRGAFPDGCTGLSCTESQSLSALDVFIYLFFVFN